MLSVSSFEVCNNLDDDNDGLVDEGLSNCDCREGCDGAVSCASYSYDACPTSVGCSRDNVCDGSVSASEFCFGLQQIAQVRYGADDFGQRVCLDFGGDLCQWFEMDNLCVPANGVYGSQTCSEIIGPSGRSGCSWATDSYITNYYGSGDSSFGWSDCTYTQICANSPSCSSQGFDTCNDLHGCSLSTSKSSFEVCGDNIDNDCNQQVDETCDIPSIKSTYNPSNANNEDYSYVLVTDEEGTQTRSKTDKSGNLKEIKEAYNYASDRTTAEYNYDVLGRLKTITLQNPEGGDHVTTKEYNSLGQLTDEYHPDTGHVSFTYDLNGNLLTSQVEGAPEKDVVIDYDVLNRVNNITWPNYEGGTTAVQYYYDDDDECTYTYYSKGKVCKIVDLSGTIEFIYNYKGQVEREVKGILPITNMVANPGFDASTIFWSNYGLGSKLIRENGVAYVTVNSSGADSYAGMHYADNTKGIIKVEPDTQYTLSALVKTGNIYGGNGHVTLDTHCHNEEHTNGNFHRVIISSGSDRVLPANSETFVRLSETITTNDTADHCHVKIYFQNDGEYGDFWVDEVQFEQAPAFSGEYKQDFFISDYAYDSSGRLVSMVYPSGKRLDYNYNSFSQLESMSLDANNDGTPDKTIVQGYVYNPTGSLASFQTGDGITTTYSYTIREWLNSLDIGDLYERSYDYDKTGNMMTMYDDLSQNNDVASYGYDKLSRIKTVNSDILGRQSYEYDKLGNRLLLNTPEKRVSYDYSYNPGVNQNPDILEDSASIRLTSMSTTRKYTDVNVGGDIVTREVGGKSIVSNSITGNAVNTVTSSTSSSELVYGVTGSLESDGTYTYEYYPNNRLKIVRENSGTIVEQYVYDYLGNRIMKKDADGEIKKLYLYDLGSTLIEEIVPITASCDDGIQSPGETGVDCGGLCPACPTCNDGIQNQDEIYIDCGGSCDACGPEICDNGVDDDYDNNADCADNDCSNGALGVPCCSVQADCPAGYVNSYDTCMNGLEACSSSVCSYADDSPVDDKNCDEAICTATGWDNSICPTCSDGVQNQDETGVDCGGVCAAVCPICSGEPIDPCSAFDADDETCIIDGGPSCHWVGDNNWDGACVSNSPLTPCDDYDDEAFCTSHGCDWGVEMQPKTFSNPQIKISEGTFAVCGTEKSMEMFCISEGFAGGQFTKAFGGGKCASFDGKDWKVGADTYRQIECATNAK